MKTKSGILTTLFSLILLLAGVFLIASNYVVLPSFLDGIKELATANIALSGGEKALMVPGIFLVAEAFMILISRTTIEEVGEYPFPLSSASSSSMLFLPAL